METFLIPTAYLPSVMYFLVLSKKGMPIIDIYENYIKQTCRNRAYIYSANGIIPLIVPVVKVFGNHTPVHAIEISRMQNWQANHWRAIESAYHSSPYFLYYKDDLKAIYKKSHKRLIDLNYDLLSFLLKATGVDTAIWFSDRYVSYDLEVNDLRKSSSIIEYGGILLNPYHQVFDSKHGFISNLSIIDLLFNLGPAASKYVDELNSRFPVL